MPCYTPLNLPWRSFSDAQSKAAQVAPSARLYDFSLANKADGRVRVSCGQCIGCLLRRSRDWAVRCHHQLLSAGRLTCHFVTLTYSESRMPRHPVTGAMMYEPDAISAFMKRLRTNTSVAGIKFFACREYGERTFRPHYHLCLFGLPLDDYKFYKRSRDGFEMYNSDTLSTAWQDRGHVVVAPQTFNTASYTARYTTKKIGSALKPGSREYATDILTGEIFEHLPEKCYSSNRPGVGHAFWLQHREQLFALGSTVIGNKRYPLPRAYLRWERESGSDSYAQYELERSRYYADAEYFDDAGLLTQMRDKLIIVDRMVRSVI